jgi:hypothetical protein
MIGMNVFRTVEGGGGSGLKIIMLNSRRKLVELVSLYGGESRKKVKLEAANNYVRISRLLGITLFFSARSVFN